MNKKLHRNRLIKFEKKWLKKHKNASQNPIEYLDFLNGIENIINGHSYEKDDRFVTYCRRDFLRKEFSDYLNDITFSGRGKFTDAFVDLTEYYSGNTWISMSSVPSGLIFKDILEQDDSYKKDGIVCIQEKNILLDMIHEFKSHIKNEVEAKKMDLFNNLNKKYDVDEKNNIPQFVYGTPDFFRKQKNDVYKARDNEIETKKDEHKIDENCIFDAFEGGYFGPSYYYFINEYENKYYFRFGYSNDGRRIENTRQDLNIHELVQNKEHYDLFIAKLKKIIQNWNNKYVNNNVMDGKQWHIEDKKNGIDIYGDNDFPENYNELSNILRKAFNVDTFINDINYNVEPDENIPREVYEIPNAKVQKYEMNLKDNIPQKVYGVPNNIQKNTIINNEEIMIHLSDLNNQDNCYNINFISYDDNSNHTTMTYDNFLTSKDFINTVVDIDRNIFDEFQGKIIEVTKNWMDYYGGTSNVLWNIIINTKLKNKTFSGGSYPENWNEFIDLLIEYENYYKSLKNNKNNIGHNNINSSKSKIEINETYLGKDGHIRDHKKEIEFPHFEFKDNTVKKIDSTIIKSSIIGFVVGDALGVPAEFLSRKTLKNNPITDMEEYGTHYQPKGTWSDDTSMTLATMDSIIHKKAIDYNDIMNNFKKWMKEAKYTAGDKCFDIGMTCSSAIYQFNGDNALECGQGAISSNGNGSLMRILPIVFWCYYQNLSEVEIIDVISRVSSLTHSHEISKLGCYLYTRYILFLLEGLDKFDSYNGLKRIDLSMFRIESKHAYSRILNDDISKLKLNDIKSSGYIVDTLEAVLWNVLTTNTYQESVLSAVNMGDDTDTVAAITGGITGIIYGFDSIPTEWVTGLKKYNYIEELISNFEKTVTNSCKEFDIDLINNLIKAMKEKRACTSAEFVSNRNVVEVQASCFSDELQKFYEFMYHNSLIDLNYMENYKKIEKKEIKDMTYDEILTVLTYHHRAERFCDGAMYQFINSGKMLECLEKILSICK